MTNKIFIDSNIWVYIFVEENEEKFKISEDFINNRSLKNTLVISYQIINEVSNVLKRKKISEDMQDGRIIENVIIKNIFI